MGGITWARDDWATSDDWEGAAALGRRREGIDTSDWTGADWERAALYGMEWVATHRGEGLVMTERDDVMMVRLIRLANGRRMVIDDPQGAVIADTRPEGASGGTASDVWEYMRGRTFAHLDRRTGEVSATGLGEDAADAFDLWEGEEADIPDWVFELAAEAAFDGEADERARRAG